MPRAESSQPVQPNQFATPDVLQGLKLTLAGKLASAPAACTSHPYHHTTNTNTTITTTTPGCAHCAHNSTRRSGLCMDPTQEVSASILRFVRIAAVLYTLRVAG